MQKTTLVLAACLAASSPLAAQRMFTTNVFAEVSSIDLATGAMTQVGVMTDLDGATDDNFPGALTYDLLEGHLYVASTIEDQIFVVDRTNWRARSLGNLGLGQGFTVHSIEMDLGSGVLYGVGFDAGVSVLFSVDTATGAATVIGNTGLNSQLSLGFDPLSNELFATDTVNDQLYRIDRQSGSASPVGALGAASYVDGMSYCIDNLTMYVVDLQWFNVYQLMTVDLATGATTAVGAAQSGSTSAIAYVAGTGRLSREAHGCGTASIFVSGNPNLGGSVEFHLDNTTGIPFLGFGVTNLGVPFCNCTVGHDWINAVPVSSATLPVPNVASLLGASVYAQGLDLGAQGGCPSPRLTLTDTIEVMVGS